jgi:DnaD/phage-associated family protein
MQLTEAEECFFYRLLVQCDDFGRFDARPAVVRSRCYPLDPDRVSAAEVERRLQRLAEVGLLFMYAHEGKCYLQMATWDKHQHKRAKHSKYPAPADICSHMQSHASTCEQMLAYAPEKRETRNESRSRSRDAENASTQPTATTNPFGEVVEAWESNGFGIMPSLAADKLRAYLDADSMEPGLLAWAMEQAAEAGPDRCNYRYVSAILDRCRQERITTRQQAEAKERSRRKQAPTTATPSQPAPRPIVKSQEEIWAELEAGEARR